MTALTIVLSKLAEHGISFKQVEAFARLNGVTMLRAARIVLSSCKE